jgi:hypothetical protein
MYNKKNFGGVMMRIFLIDYENMNEESFSQLKIKENDEAVLFYTQNKNKVKFESLWWLGKNVRYEKCPIGTNKGCYSYILTFLEYLMFSSINKNDFIYDACVLVSNDIRYDSLIEFWQKEELRGNKIGLIRFSTEEGILALYRNKENVTKEKALQIKKVCGILSPKELEDAFKITSNIKKE